MQGVLRTQVMSFAAGWGCWFIMAVSAWFARACVCLRTCVCGLEVKRSWYYVVVFYVRFSVCQCRRGKIAGGISAAVKAGKDINSLMPQFGKLAQLEADINCAEQGKHKGPLGRLTSSEQEGFAIAQAKIAHRDAMEDLRSQCRLYGSPGPPDPADRAELPGFSHQKQTGDCGN